MLSALKEACVLGANTGVVLFCLNQRRLSEAPNRWVGWRNTEGHERVLLALLVWPTSGFRI